jgi:hypothetical protein
VELDPLNALPAHDVIGRFLHPDAPLLRDVPGSIEAIVMTGLVLHELEGARPVDGGEVDEHHRTSPVLSDPPHETHIRIGEQAAETLVARMTMDQDRAD